MGGCQNAHDTFEYGMKKYGLKKGDTVALFSPKTIWSRLLCWVLIVLLVLFREQIQHIMLKTDSARFLFTVPSSMDITAAAAENASGEPLLRGRRTVADPRLRDLVGDWLLRVAAHQAAHDFALVDRRLSNGDRGRQPDAGRTSHRRSR